MDSLVPIRWPGVWRDPSTLSLLKGSVVNCLIVEPGNALDAVVARARQQGLQVAYVASPPSGVSVVTGQWPGVKLSESGAVDQADAGPTGVPWVDSNGWKIRLTSALHPGAAVWVNAAAPKGARLSAESYLVAVADAAAHGGQWIISLDDQLAQDVAGQKPEALQTWNLLTGAVGFFAARQDWSAYVPEAVVGIISDFSPKNEFLSNEILNLVARANQQYRVIPAGRLADSSLNGLRAVLYADADPPAPDLRKRILAFVQAGGMLITGPQWGEAPGTLASGDQHPRYAVQVLGKGRVAVARTALDDPYLIANDSVVLVSHRHELLRLWNPGAASACLTISPDRKRAVVQLVFYSPSRVQDGPTVRVAGRYRTARLWSLDRPAPRNVEMVAQKDAVELRLPRVTVYASVELGV
jgi:hypothetical protein